MASAEGSITRFELPILRKFTTAPKSIRLPYNRFKSCFRIQSTRPLRISKPRSWPGTRLRASAKSFWSSSLPKIGGVPCARTASKASTSTRIVNAAPGGTELSKAQQASPAGTLTNKRRRTGKRSCQRSGNRRERSRYLPCGQKSFRSAAAANESAGPLCHRSKSRPAMTMRFRRVMQQRFATATCLNNMTPTCC